MAWEAAAPRPAGRPGYSAVISAACSRSPQRLGRASCRSSTTDVGLTADVQVSHLTTGLGRLQAAVGQRDSSRRQQGVSDDTPRQRLRRATGARARGSSARPAAGQEPARPGQAGGQRRPRSGAVSSRRGGRRIGTAGLGHGIAGRRLGPATGARIRCSAGQLHRGQRQRRPKGPNESSSGLTAAGAPKQQHREQVRLRARRDRELDPGPAHSQQAPEGRIRFPARAPPVMASNSAGTAPSSAGTPGTAYPSVSGAGDLRQDTSARCRGAGRAAPEPAPGFRPDSPAEVRAAVPRQHGQRQPRRSARVCIGLPEP